MELFYDPFFESSKTFLNEDDSKHCIKVLRHKKGDNIQVIDGKGNLFFCTIIDDHSKQCQLKINDIEYIEPALPHIHIAIAPTKNIDRFEWFLEKVTEIGISEITPLLTDHSERKQIRLDRLDKIVVSAMKQSLKFHKPKLNDLTSFQQVILSAENANRYIAHCSDTEINLLTKTYPSQTNALILIGPEGDFSEQEISKALDVGFQPVSLGKSRLRTETAGIVACSIFAILNEL